MVRAKAVCHTENMLMKVCIPGCDEEIYRFDLWSMDATVA
jgi:hypothetical protein